MNIDTSHFVTVVGFDVFCYRCFADRPFYFGKVSIFDGLRFLGLTGLCESPCRNLNPGPLPYQGNALPAELHGHRFWGYVEI